MWVLKVLLYYNVLFLNLVIPLQFNLYLTEWNNNLNRNDIVLQHDCLRIDAWENKKDIYEIISYCISEWPSSWTIHANNFNQHFTFAELSQRNITSEHLYHWSAPIDLIENYQHYLDELLISNKILFSTYVYYNCTLPNFDSMCQYSFDEYESSYSSFQQIIYEFYTTVEYQSKNHTCYTHL